MKISIQSSKVINICFNLCTFLHHLACFLYLLRAVSQLTTTLHSNYFDKQHFASIQIDFPADKWEFMTGEMVHKSFSVIGHMWTAADFTVTRQLLRKAIIISTYQAYVHVFPSNIGVWTPTCEV